MSRANWQRLTALVVAVLAAVGAYFIIDDNPAPTVTSHVDGADADHKADDTVTAPGSLVSEAEDSQVGDHKGLHDETPLLAPDSQLVQAQKQQDRIRRTQKPLPAAGATQGFPGCTTKFVSNQSSRNGVRPQQIWDHYTVSPNRPGWPDVWAVVSLFDRPSFQASSNFVIDGEGHCAYIVPIERKSWTQAAANPIAISIEVINSGRESLFMAPAGYARLAAVHREIGRRAGIPMQRGAVRGCTSAKKGIVQHKDGGLCAGGHVDITPFSIDQVIRVTRQVAGPSTLLPVERAVATKRCYHRREYLAGHSKATNLKWARYYRGRILIKDRRSAKVGGHTQLITAIDIAKWRDQKTWAYRHRGSRRAELVRVWSGKGC